MGGSISAACVPVNFMGRALGVLHVTGAKGKPPNPEQIAQLTALGVHAGNRIGTLRAFERSQLQASTDSLTGLTNRRAAEEVLANLDRLAFDLEQIAARHGLEKIKTIGDAFMVTANLLEPHPDPVMAGVRFAFEMVEAARRNPAGWQVRLGIHVGSVIAGVIGRSKFSFDLWGDTVNTAARLSDLGFEGGVYLSGAAWERVAGRCPGRCLGRVSLKGKGEIEVYLGATPDRGLAQPFV